MADKIIDDLSFQLLISNLNFFTKTLGEQTKFLKSCSDGIREIAVLNSELVDRMNELDGRLFAIEHTQHIMDY
jgi:hypothetical protein